MGRLSYMNRLLADERRLLLLAEQTDFQRLSLQHLVRAIQFRFYVPQEASTSFLNYTLCCVFPLYFERKVEATVVVISRNQTIFFPS